MVGSSRTGRVLEAGSDREDRYSDVRYVGDTRKSFSEKDDDSIPHFHHICRIVSHSNTREGESVLRKHTFFLGELGVLSDAREDLAVSVKVLSDTGIASQLHLKKCMTQWTPGVVEHELWSRTC